MKRFMVYWNYAMPKQDNPASFEKKDARRGGGEVVISAESSSEAVEQYATRLSSSSFTQPWDRSLFDGTAVELVGQSPLSRREVIKALKSMDGEDLDDLIHEVIQERM